MRKAGKWLLIFGIIAFVSAVAFGWSVVALGVQNDNYGITIAGHDISSLGKFNFGGFNMGKAGIKFNDNNTVITYDFEKNKEFSGAMDATGLSDIKLELASCKAKITCADTDKVSVTYTSTSTPVEFEAKVKDGVLTISEKLATLFNFNMSSGSDLNVTVPKTLYNSIDVDMASGKITSDALTTDTFTANVASGSLEMGIYSETVDVNLASGKVILTNSTDSVCNNIKLDVASGSIEMTGYKADNIKASIASGGITLNGISGKVKGDLASGKLVLTYAEWNDDLDIHLLSGKCDVTLPAGSGVNASLSKLSGGMSIELDGQSAKLDGNSNLTLGGSNVHNVKGDVASGNISIHN